MKAVCWYGVNDVRVARVPDPQVLNPRDAIVRITRTAICGSDLQLFDGLVPGMKRGDVLGHEFMGEVVEVGRDNHALAPGDRVVVPFTIACGRCFFCQRQLWALCDNANPNAANVERMYGYAPSGLFGYSHLTGGYAGGQAQFARVPFADVGPLKVPESVSDEQALLLSDVLPAGYMAAEHCGIAPGDTIAVWGCGPVGQFAIQFAWKLGAGRVIAIDRVPARLAMANGTAKAETIDRTRMDVLAALKDMTGGRGPDACIDAVGMESHAAGIGARRDRTALLRDGGTALREAIYACRKGGTVSVPGVYGGLMDSVPLGAAFDKGLTLKLGHSHVQRYMPMLLDWIAAGEIDPASVITHRMPLDEAADAYRMLRDETAGCVKVVLTP